MASLSEAHELTDLAIYLQKKIETNLEAYNQTSINVTLSIPYAITGNEIYLIYNVHSSYNQ